MNDLVSTPLSSAPPDTAALAWVLEQVRDNLLGALAAVRRQAQLGALAGAESDTTSALLQARTHVHQAAGALELLGQAGAARVLHTAERALIGALEQPTRLDAPMIEALESALHAALDFLEARAGGRDEPAVKLFRQYRALADLAGGEPAHPADLWDVPWDWPHPAGDDTGARPLGQQARSDYERALLDVLRAGDLRGAGRAMQGVAHQASQAASSDERALWWIAEGFFSALGDELLDTDIYVKRLCNRLNLQLRQMLAGQSQASRRLGHELAFFCDQALARARALDRPAPEALQSVARALGLRGAEVVDWQQPYFGLVDPALVQQARKRMLQVKDGWAHIGNGDFSRIARLQENLQQLGVLMRQLCTGAEVLPAAAERMVGVIGEQHALLTPERVLEVATALLFLEASLVHFRADDADFLPHARELAQRLQRSAQGYASEAFAPWMEELYRKVSETQTLGTVVQELRHDMGTVEHLLDAYFRNPATLPELEPVPRLLGQMRGVLSVLGMDVGAQALGHIRHSVENLLATAPDETAARQPGGPFDRLAANIGALGFMIDMLGYQPELAKASFQFDPRTGELRPVVPHARQAAPAPAQAPAVAPAEMAALDASAAAFAPALTPEPAAPQSFAPTTVDDAEATPTEPPPLEEADTLVPPAEPQDATEQLGMPQQQPAPAMLEPDLDALLLQAAPAQPAPAADEAVDPELLEIFLDEADEVVGEGRQRVADLRSAEPADDSLTALRRCFHTLKGSSRMVGMRDFGEAAWALEQSFNQVLAEGGPAPAELLDLASHALDRLEAWAHALRAGDAQGHSSTELVRAAQRLRDGQPAEVLAAVPPARDATPQSQPEPQAQAEAHAQPEAEASPEPQAEALPGLELPDLALAPEQPAPNDEELARLLQADAFEPALEQPQAEQASDAAETEAAQAPLPEPASEAAQPAPDEAGLAGEEPAGEDAQHPPVAEAPAWLSRPEIAPWPDASLLDLDGAGAQAGAAQEPASPPPHAERADSWQPGAASELPEVAAPAHEAHETHRTHEAQEPLEPLEPLEHQEAEQTGDIHAVDEAQQPREFEHPSPQAAGQDAGATSDDQESRVDESRIPQALQAIYLNEADDLVRRLDQSLSAWAMLPQLAIGPAPMALAHQLRGSSATVGLRSVQQLAGLLEQAIQAQGAHPLALLETERDLLPQALEQIRGLLHQFAAGFLRPPQAELVDALQSLVRRLEELGPEATPEQPDELSPPTDEAAASAHADSAPAPAWPWELEPQASDALDAVPQAPGPAVPAAPTWAPAQPGDELEVHEQAPAALADLAADWLTDELAQGGPAAPAPAPAPAAVPDVAPELRDSIDAELFPIFEFEAADLLPQLGNALRQWESHAGDRAAPREAMRLLHTFKGSARMAGTMALGDMAHALESDIEALLSGDGRPDEQAVMELTGRFDALNTRFERLREANARGESELGDIHPERALLEEQAMSVEEPARVPGADDAAHAAAASQPLRGFERSQPVRVQAALLDRLVNQVGEVSIARARLDNEFELIRGSVRDLGDNLSRLRAQVRDIELQADAQMAARTQAARDDGRGFDPLEFDRFTRFQELTRMMAESVDDLALVQNSLGRALQSTEDNLTRQSRLTRELQRDLLRTRMVEFDSISERLYRTVRQASKDAAKPVRLDIQGGTIELDRGVLDRMAPAFEHLLRNAVAHGLETPAEREAAGKQAVGTITLRLRHDGSEVVVSVSDDGGGLRYGDIAAKARSQGLLGDGEQPTQAQLREFIFQPGFSSAARTTEMAGRGVGLDVVRTDTRALGGRVEVESVAGRGTTFTLVLPLTTAVTQVVLLRSGERIHAVPSSLVDLVLRMRPSELDAALREQQLEHGGQQLPLYWLGALTDESGASAEVPLRTVPVVLVRSAAQRLALHVDEVLGNQEVVVKNLGPQLSRVPGLVGISVLPDGGVVLIYNPVALAAVYGDKAAARMREQAGTPRVEAVVAAPHAATPSANTVLVVDDSITVRRVTQRFLTRNGYSVMLAKDGLDALEQLQQSLPDVVLTDIEMPRMDGFDLTRNIRADERTRHLPVIMITSRIADKHRNYAQELGVNHYLGKPYSEDELLGLLREYVLESAVD
jgi:chemosensory pili system protein ChpA (sensor histidine kinase/response regulator)